MSAQNRDCTIAEGRHGRRILVYAHNSAYAWAGSSLDRHDRGMPTGRSQICNFESAEEAERYAAACGLHVVRKLVAAPPEGGAA